ncbi:hypothetical protein [Draconibacterium sp.]|uniref:hypothetical protein n=1 Tax=Draconibacterium sp. TaxID=1965318 RepID=UPI00356A6C70
MGKNSKDYIPSDKYQLEAWAKQFAATVINNVGKYGISQEQADAINSASQEYSGDLVTEKQLVDQKNQQVKLTQTDRKTLVKLSRNMAQFIKNNPNYTDKVGKEFDIIGAEVHHDTDNAQPVLKAKKVPHGWEFSFGLESYYSGVNIYRKRPGEENFSYLATDTRSPYVDNQQMENGTQYYAYFILGDIEVGQQSDVVTVGV